MRLTTVQNVDIDLYQHDKRFKGQENHTIRRNNENNKVPQY